MYSFDCNLDELIVSGSESGGNDISFLNENPPKFYPHNKLNTNSQFKLSGNLSSGNKDKTEIEFSPPVFTENLTFKFIREHFGLNPVFVDIAYLKELRTTKMLC